MGSDRIVLYLEGPEDQIEKLRKLIEDGTFTIDGFEIVSYTVEDIESEEDNGCA